MSILDSLQSLVDGFLEFLHEHVLFTEIVYTHRRHVAHRLWLLYGGMLMHKYNGGSADIGMFFDMNLMHMHACICSQATIRLRSMEMFEV